MLQVENTKLSTLKHRKYNLIFKKQKIHECMQDGMDMF